MEKYIIAERAVNGGTQKVYRYENDFGASVVRHNSSYGQERGLWELAVIEFTSGNNDDFHLTYDTNITSDVLGHLTDEKVLEALVKIKALQEEGMKKMDENLTEHGSLIKTSEWSSLSNNERYGNLEELKEMILYKKVVEVTKDKIELENGIILTIECSESDCCAGGGGEFEFDKYNIPLEAVITDFNIGEQVDIPDDDTRVSQNTITLFHNQNPIVKANATTDAGNGGYYYSVTSLVIDNVHFPFVEA